MNVGITFLGIEIGGTKLQLATGAANGEIINKKRYTIAADGGAAAIRQQLEEGLHLLGVNGVAAIGVGFGGPVDWQAGTIKVSHQVTGWNDVNLVQWITALTNKPVIIDNDANTAALAEAAHGNGKGYERVFYLTIGSGIGGGLIIDGKIYHGRVPGEVEVGHLRLTKAGDTLEDRCSGWAVNKTVRTVIEQHPGCLLSQLSKDRHGPEAILLKPALEKEDAIAKKIMKDVADDLSFALSHVIHLFHPDVIIIGGGLSLLGNHLLEPVQYGLEAYVMKAFLPPPVVKLALLGEDVVPLGAIELAKNAYNNASFY